MSLESDSASPPPAEADLWSDDEIPAPSFAAAMSQPVHCSTLQQAPPHRKCWKKKRFWGLVAVLITGASAGVVSLYRGHQTRIVFINVSSEFLPALTVTAAGFSHQVPALEGEASHRWILPDGGSPAPITIRTNSSTAAPWQWEGDLIQSGTGIRLLLHLQPDGTVEPVSSSSIWQDLTGE